jgi:hypothetical protein
LISYEIIQSWRAKGQGHSLSIELEYSVPSGHERRCRAIVTLENFAPSNNEQGMKSENNADGEEVHLAAVLWGTTTCSSPSKKREV